MARIDKVDSVGGVCRAQLAAAWAGQAAPIGVGLDVNGRLVVGAGNSGLIGVLCIPTARKAGQQVDIVKFGELVEFAGVAGTTYWADGVTGVIAAGVAGGGAPAAGAGTGAGSVRIGHTIEATRLFVHVRSA